MDHKARYDLLPPVAKELIAMVGQELATKFMDVFGGKTLWFPSTQYRPSGRRAAIAAVVGDKAAHKICVRFAGANMYIPMCSRLAAQARHRRIISDYNSGLGVRAIARKYEITDRCVWLVLKKPI